MADKQLLSTEHTIEAATHGRYLVSAGAAAEAMLLVGFHGYGETVEEELTRLRAIPGLDHWTVAAVEGLHRFYRRRTNEVVASWMTRQNRELAIADNVGYVSNVIGRVAEQYSAGATLVVAGFSQGVAMAYRCAASLNRPVAAVIACGGDAPPELDATALSRIPAALIARGVRDEWYTAEKLTSDRQRLHAAGVVVQTVVLDASHEWTSEFSAICGAFLQSLTE